MEEISLKKRILNLPVFGHYAIREQVDIAKKVGILEEKNREAEKRTEKIDGTGRGMNKDGKSKDA